MGFLTFVVTCASTVSNIIVNINNNNNNNNNNDNQNNNNQMTDSNNVPNQGNAGGGRSFIDGKYFRSWAVDEMVGGCPKRFVCRAAASNGSKLVAMFAAREISVASRSPRLLEAAAYFVDRELSYVESCDSVECQF